MGSDQVGDVQSRFTFAELAAEQISSRQLYAWSASIDLVERYQFYLTESSSLIQTTMETEFFYNCTWPRFGSFCDYMLDFDQDERSWPTLSEVVHDFYLKHPYHPKTLTCYTHLQCNRGPSPSCLDWSEICNGQIDCLDGGKDEEHCWQLEFNECEENEYRSANGQCIPEAFRFDDNNYYDCLDGSDEGFPRWKYDELCKGREPILNCEDVVCSESSFDRGPPLTYSCVLERRELLYDAIRTLQPANMSDRCWEALNCLVDWPWYGNDKDCSPLCDGYQCEEIIADVCLDGLLFIPSVPVFFGHVYLAYEKTQFDGDDQKIDYAPSFICYNDRFCGGSSENLTCHRPDELSLNFTDHFIVWKWRHVSPLYERFRPCSLHEQHCPSDTLYQCQNSTKCLSRHRLLDKRTDCFNGDDEQLSFVQAFIDVESSKEFYQCMSSNVYIAARLVRNGYCDCPMDDKGFCDDEFPEMRNAIKHISFPTTCDGFIDLLPVMIDGALFTDESECDYWRCNTIYTRCNGVWNCLAGEDEIDCDPLALTSCSPDQRLCVQPSTNELQCLPVEKLNDGHIDCLGASDEVNQCRTHTIDFKTDQFYCANDTIHRCIRSGLLCDRRADCLHGDDEQFCSSNSGATVPEAPCYYMRNMTMYNEIERFICHRFSSESKALIMYFTINHQMSSNKHTDAAPSITLRDLGESTGRCHRGLPVKRWSDGRELCFCPPSFYGDQCEYQNERVGLIIQFRALSSSWQTLFDIAVFLIDDSDQRRIHSSEQFTYLPMRDCQMKFHLHLLYNTRPKNASFNYSVHIDLYEKETLTYRSSWLIPLRFGFLPVQRLAVQLNIPRVNSDKDLLCYDRTCNHGRCLKYINDRQSFCQCQTGWSGPFCDIPSSCQCSPDAVCLGEDFYQQSICLCPIGRFGRRCYIENDVCDEKNSSLICLNGGRCVPSSGPVLEEQGWTCLCPKEFTGDRCERKQTSLIITFDEKMTLPPSMLIHFIESHRWRDPDHSTTFKSIPINDAPIRIYRPKPFDLVFLELLEQDYYLAVAGRSALEQVEKKVSIADRCLPINEIFNESIAQLHLLRRIKFYHLPCAWQSSPVISCFFDDIHLCFCQPWGIERVSNCLEFNHRMKRDCLGQNGCENGAQCFQDDATCPQTSIYICAACFYGTRCQFSMNGFSLSLDAILSDHIRPHVPIRRQSFLIVVALIVTLVMTVIGWSNGILALITFKNKKVREVGCGYYMLGSSLSTLVTMTMFVLKFLFLLGIQMGSVTNRTFQAIQCVSVDFLVRVGLNMDQWLMACVAIERAMMIIQETRFSKAKSRQKAKAVIPSLLIVVVISTVYDPIYRRLLDDQSSDDEQRTWCIVSYPSSLRVLDSVINMAHFLVPFAINFISATVIIWKGARQRANVRGYFVFKELLGEQLRQHRHLLTTPILVILLGLPRIVISVLSGCLKSG